MKVYFTAAISNVSDDMRKIYARIIQILDKNGHTVISHMLQIKTADQLKAQTEADALAAHKKISKWKKQADLVLVEASTPSFGVGQEIAEALTDNKQVVVLYMTGKKPHILQNQGQEALYFVEYSESNLEKVLEEYIEYAKEHSDTRFNFFISPQIGTYLDWISRKKKLPRAVYLRRLIEDDMKLNKEYDEE
ncbi:MAG: hypothetical protein WCG44_02925 [bacterium]